MKVCGSCGAKWRGDTVICPFDGAALHEEPDPLIGRALQERYLLLDRIGEGGMGVVYRGRDADAGRDVAIKVLSPELSVEPAERERFLREARACERIRHPNVIEMCGAGSSEEGLVFLVMELLHGEPLGRVLARGPMAPARVVSIGAQLAAGLAEAHALDTIHRDIKPENVFLHRPPRSDGEETAKVLDFGLARLKGSMRLTATGVVFGTPEYMAPEQGSGGALTEKVDLYAAGCVLYAMLTGGPPFRGGAATVVLQHIRQAPAPPSAHVGSLPPGLEELVLVLLEKDPARRPTAAELAAALRRLPGPGAIP